MKLSESIDKNKHYGRVFTKDGLTSLTLNNKESFQKRLLELVGKDVEITVKEKKSTRSIEANNLYWVWMTVLGEDIGHSKEAMHFVFKKLFLADKMPALDKDEFMEYLQGLDKEIASTRKLTTAEMSQYMDKVYKQSIELNINLPIPELQGITDEK